MIYQGTARYPVTEIILHCADTRPDWMTGRPIAEKVAEIRRWHFDDGGLENRHPIHPGHQTTLLKTRL